MKNIDLKKILALILSIILIICMMSLPADGLGTYTEDFSDAAVLERDWSDTGDIKVSITNGRLTRSDTGYKSSNTTLNACKPTGSYSFSFDITIKTGSTSSDTTANVYFNKSSSSYYNLRFSRNGSTTGGLPGVGIALLQKRAGSSNFSSLGIYQGYSWALNGTYSYHVDFYSDANGFVTVDCTSGTTKTRIFDQVAVDSSIANSGSFHINSSYMAYSFDNLNIGDSTPAPTPVPSAPPVPADSPVPSATPSVTETPIPTPIPTPTNTPSPSDVPTPTDTPAPTETPVPTNTPSPTNVPSPTNTPDPSSFYDDFEAAEINTGWWSLTPTATTGVSMSRIADPTGTSSGCLQYKDSNTSVKPLLQHVMANPLTGVVTVQFKLMIASSGGGFSDIQIRNSSGIIARVIDNAGIKLDNSLEGVGGSAANSVLVASGYDRTKWYQYKFVINTEDQMFDVYINNVLKVKNAYFKNNVSNLDRIWVSSPDWGTATINLDEVSMTTGSDFEVEPSTFDTSLPGEAKSNVYITCNRVNANPVTVITAGYNQNGQLLTVDTSNINTLTPMQKRERILITTKLNVKDLPITNIKTFVWNDPVNLKPVGKLAVNPYPYSIRILCLGDSITQGKDIVPTYRYYLWKKLVDDNYNFDFVGSMLSGAGSTYPYQSYKGLSFDKDHEGHWGWRISATDLGINENLPTWMKTYKYGVNIALVHLGTNDEGDGDTAAEIKEQMRETIAILRGKYPNIAIFVGLPFQVNRIYPQISAEFRALVNEVSTSESPVFAVDHSVGWNPTIITSDPKKDTVDGVHPNEQGSEKMANNWYQVLKPYLDTYYGNHK